MPTVEKINRVHNARRKLRRRPADVSLVYLAGAYDLNIDWLKAFSIGKYPNPHTRILEKLEVALDEIAERA
jgi:hypothetical protein